MLMTGKYRAHLAAVLDDGSHVRSVSDEVVGVCLGI